MAYAAASFEETPMRAVAPLCLLLLLLACQAQAEDPKRRSATGAALPEGVSAISFTIW